MKIAELMALTEASNGFVGGSYVDEMPHLTLTECIGGLNTMLLESQLEMAEDTISQNDALVEAAVSVMQGGSTEHYEDLIEMSFADIKAKVKKIFEAIKNFLRSIISKLTVQIDKIRMKGSQLYAKYKDSKLLNKDFSKMTVTGYKFAGDKLFPSAASFDQDVEKLITGVYPKVTVPSEFTNKINEAKKTAKDGTESTSVSNKTAIQKVIDDLKDQSAKSQALAMAKKLIGYNDMAEGSWESDVKKKIYGEKTELKYGTDFDMKKIGEQLESPKNLELIKDEYKKLEAGVSTYEGNLQRELDKITSNEGDKHSSDYVALASAYYNAYMSMVNNAYGVISKVKGIKVGYEQEKDKQAKMIFGKMLSYKAGKENADASEDEVFADFESEI